MTHEKPGIENSGATIEAAPAASLTKANSSNRFFKIRIRDIITKSKEF